MRNAYYNPRFLLYDLERLFSFFIMTYKGSIRESVISTALDINRCVYYPPYPLPPPSLRPIERFSLS